MSKILKVFNLLRFVLISYYLAKSRAAIGCRVTPQTKHRSNYWPFFPPVSTFSCESVDPFVGGLQICGNVKKNRNFYDVCIQLDFNFVYVRIVCVKVFFTQKNSKLELRSDTTTMTQQVHLTPTTQQTSHMNT